MRTLSFALSTLVLLAWPKQQQHQQSSVVEGSFFGHQHHEQQHKDLTMRESSYCGPHHMPCGAAEPCCNNGTCHTTTMEACPIALGCNPRHSYLDGCFALPGCKSFKDTFKHPNLLIPKKVFSGDPNQAYWISDFHHIAPYAKVDPHTKKLVLRARRDMVKTQSGGGFGATVSSTRWNQYGTFTAKFKSGATGPGIVTAFLLSNPVMGEEISFELTGRDPKKVVTNYYRRMPSSSSSSDDHDDRHPHEHLKSRSILVSHEETLDLKKDSTLNELVYKIEWTEHHIRWSVDGKVLRTVLAKDVHPNGAGLPTNAMQLQLTIWDAGHASETQAWSGGKTDYGPDNLAEYIMTIDSVDFACQDNKQGQKPWPGPEATKRLKLAQSRAEANAKRFKKLNGGGRGSDSHNRDGSHDHLSGSSHRTMWARFRHFLEWSILSLIKWTFVLLSLVCGAAYFTEPKTKTRVVNPNLNTRNLGLSQ